MPVTEYSFQMTGGVPVVTAPAEIDTTNAGELRAILFEWHSRGHATVVVDLTGTRFRDSAGLRELARAHQRAVADGGGLRLVTRADGAFMRIFTIIGLDDIIPHFATLEQALAQVPAAAIRPLRRGAAGKPAAASASPPARVREPAARPLIAAAVSSAARRSRRSASTRGSAPAPAGPPGTAISWAIRRCRRARSPGRWPR